MCLWLPDHETDQIQTGKKQIKILSIKGLDWSLPENKPKQWRALPRERHSNGIGETPWISQLNEWTYSFFFFKDSVWWGFPPLVTKSPD